MIDFEPAYLWVDLQMSGLNPLENKILQFACILSNKDLTKFEEGPHIIIHCDEEHLSKMDQWNTSHHKSSGLYQSCLNSTITTKQAEDTIIDYLRTRGIIQNQVYIAGNSIHMDKLFLFHHMPRLNEFLHYRILDVTSIKLVVNTLKPSLFYKKQNTHRALDDIKQSIGELKFYLDNCFSK